MIQVTKPFFPPKEEYDAYLAQIWQNEWLTNNGPLLQLLEERLKNYLQVPHLLMMTNGTVTLQALLKSLGKKGKVLTTPFSYVATTSSILWEGFTPSFVDVDPKTFNADPNLAHAAIDEDTVAILITHCFGVPCDVDAWQKISDEHQLPVIYDAAHAFGVKVDGVSVLTYGYASSLSFHATKLFHTVEGGAVVLSNEFLEKEMQLRRNFGHDGPDRFSEIGINGKNSEVHAAMGLVNLTHIDAILESRKNQYEYYKQYLNASPVSLQFQFIPPGVTHNYSYFPVVFPTEEILLHIFHNLQKYNIFTRRYFYPTLNSLPFSKQYGGETPIAESISRRVLCLPLYHSLKRSEQDFVLSSLLNLLQHV